MTPNIPTHEERIDFWKHSYARSSFIETQSFVNELLSINPPPNSPTRRAFTMATLGVYCRPFKQRRNIRLSEDIVPDQHKETHDTLILLRDKVIAHRDLDAPITDWGFVSQLQFNVRDEQLTVDTISSIMSNEVAYSILELLPYLIETMDIAMDLFFANHLSNLGCNDATYTISLETDPDQWLLQQRDNKMLR